VTIRDPGCVAKTFPEYFGVFGRITGGAGAGRPVADPGAA
jgi:hypothetical protein